MSKGGGRNGSGGRVGGGSSGGSGSSMQGPNWKFRAHVRHFVNRGIFDQK